MNLINAFINHMITLVAMVLAYGAIMVATIEIISLVGRILRYFAQGGLRK